MGKPCAQCGHELDEAARVCTQCGTPVSPPMPTAAQTMIGFTSPLAAPARAPVAPPQQPAPPVAPQPAPAKPAPMAQTMLGFAAPNLQVPIAAAPAPAPPPPAPTPAAPVAGMKTMLGVAVPGIAPLAASAPQPQPAAPQSAKVGLGSGTILGVAMPGIAPTHAHAHAGAPAPQPMPMGNPGRTMLLEQPPPIVPAPAPFVPEAAPSAPVVVKRRGIPLAAVAILASVVVLGGGAALLFFARGAGSLTATAKVSADGKEQLHLVCEGCPDGTKATWKGVSASFTQHQADLALPAPLAIGDNTFEIALDRPGVGRDETIKLVLPLAYRIRGDLAGLAASPPELRVDVEAEKGESVTVDGKPVALDANGKATVPYDVTADTTGTTDEARTIERKIPYEVVGKDRKKSSGEVAMRVAVVPLHLDAPGLSIVSSEPRVWVAGKTSKGAAVTANGTPVAVAADGSFEGQIDLTDGEQTIVVRATPADATKAAPRTATVRASRVASLDAEAKKLGAAATLGGDALVRDPTGAVGQNVAVVGSVVDARSLHHHAVLLVDDKRDCKSGPCLVRVEYGGDVDLKTGDAIAAYGVVAKPVTTPDGKTLPAVDAALVRKPAKR